MSRLTVVLLSAIGASVLAALGFGAWRWNSETQAVLARMNAAPRAIVSLRYDSAEVESLPPPVRRYLHKVLTPGQSVVSSLDIEQTGTFNMSNDAEQWRAFRATQRVTTHVPGFVWIARMRFVPGVDARVYDAYVTGHGILHASLFGLVSLVNLRGTPEMATGELMRFLAESPWYPTVLLPSQGVRWSAIDEGSAQATLVDGSVSASVVFHFGADSLVEMIRAEARGRTVGDSIVLTPWEGRFQRYERRDGMLVPIEGEVAWVLASRRLPYWRGTNGVLRYEFAR